MVKNLPANAGDARDVGSIPGSGRSPAVGNGNPLWCSCLENSTDRGAWQAKNWTRLSNWARAHLYPEVELLDPMGILSLTYWGIAKQFSTGTALFYIPPAPYESSDFSPSLPRLLLFHFAVILVGKCDPTCHDCVSLIVNDVECLFLRCWPLVHFLWRWVYSSLCP